MRQQRGLSQEELAAAVGVSRRVIAYYEAESPQLPGAHLIDLARAFKVSADELLGLEPLSEKTSPKTARLLKRLRRVEELPPADQRAVLKLVDAMLETRRRTAPSPRSKRKAAKDQRSSRSPAREVPGRASWLSRFTLGGDERARRCTPERRR